MRRRDALIQLKVGLVAITLPVNWLFRASSYAKTHTIALYTRGFEAQRGMRWSRWLGGGGAYREPRPRSSRVDVDVRCPSLNPRYQPKEPFAKSVNSQLRRPHPKKEEDGGRGRTSVVDPHLDGKPLLRSNAQRLEHAFRPRQVRKRRLVDQRSVLGEVGRVGILCCLGQ